MPFFCTDTYKFIVKIHVRLIWLWQINHNSKKKLRPNEVELNRPNGFSVYIFVATASILSQCMCCCVENYRKCRNASMLWRRKKIIDFWRKLFFFLFNLILYRCSFFFFAAKKNECRFLENRILSVLFYFSFYSQENILNTFNRRLYKQEKISKDSIDFRLFVVTISDLSFSLGCT